MADDNHHDRVLESLQELTGFQEGELICVYVSPFPAFGKSFAYAPALWKIMDAKLGVVDSGFLTVEMAQAVASRPSACRGAEAFLKTN